MYKFLSSLFCFLFLFFSCHSPQKTNPDGYTLKRTDTQLTFPLDDKTKIYIFSLQIYKDISGEEYLVIQNQTYRQLLFYNLQTQKLLKKIICNAEGPDAVPRFSGFYVRNMDEIYLSNTNLDGMSMIDGQGKPRKLYKGKTKEGQTVMNAAALTWKKIQQLNNNLYIPLHINREYGKDVKFQKSNLCGTLNLETGELELLPLTYFDIIEREADDLIVAYYSRCTNGKEFIYSFEDSEDLYVTNLAHTTLRKIKVKSKYLPSLHFKPQEFSMASPDNCSSMEKPRYGTILYDPYQKIYYWIAYPEADIEKGINCFDLMACGGKNFSIIILNEDFEIIGETLMPDYTYNPKLCFVRKDGLYISESHIFNSNFDENKLCFRRFELVKKK